MYMCVCVQESVCALAFEGNWVYVCLHCIDFANICFYRISHTYVVATISRIDQIIGLFCRISSLL